MKSYPSISSVSGAPRKPCYAFIKYDGSNIRVEWSPKRGFYKFGTRHQLFDETHETLGEAKKTFLDKYDKDLNKIFRNKPFKGIQSIIVFGEFFGEGSFSGQHLSNKPKDFVVFDINIHKKGFISPKEFINEIPNGAELVYQGNLNEILIQSVRNYPNSSIDLQSKLSIKTRIPEGVICKGGSGHDLWMCKIKTIQYMEELKKVYENRWQQFWE